MGRAASQDHSAMTDWSGDHVQSAAEGDVLVHGLNAAEFVA